MSKPFDYDLYVENDPAKHLIVEWLASKGFDAWVNPDLYGIDILAKKNGQQYGFEVEVKHNWTGEQFPFDTVHFPARKHKFIAPRNYFIMLNSQCTAFALVDWDAISSSTIVAKETKYTESEQFMAVPLSKCRLIWLD